MSKKSGKTILEGKLFTIPNLISSFRIFFILPISLAILNEKMTSAFILVTVSYLTDVADGIIARMLNQESEFGRIIDPLTDKVTLIVVLCCLSMIGRFPIWALFLIVSREIVILS